MSETRAVYQTNCRNPQTGERFLIYRETPCPACAGDGWRVTEDDDDLCPECDGLGVKLEEIAIQDSLEAIEPFLSDNIPFRGEAFPARIVTEQDEYF